MEGANLLDLTIVWRFETAVRAISARPRSWRRSAQRSAALDVRGGAWRAIVFRACRHDRLLIVRSGVMAAYAVMLDTLPFAVDVLGGSET